VDAEPLMLTADQLKRRTRIVQVARALATGGYRAVNMRMVATKSDIAPATLYCYFPSKDHLLVTCLFQWLTDFQVKAIPELAGIIDPYDRLLTLVDRLNASLCATPGFADAVARAYLFADETVGVLVEDTRAELSEMLADGMGAGAVTREHLDIGELIADVWAANVLAVVHRRATANELRHRLRLTIDMTRRRRLTDIAVEDSPAHWHLDGRTPTVDFPSVQRTSEARPRAPASTLVSYIATRLD
jgi:AcrR family transcriptional regulator